MRKVQQNLSNHQPDEFYVVAHKMVLNETIEKKDFSTFYFKSTRFFNCNFKNIGFASTRCNYLTFYNCQFNNVTFAKAELLEITFRNCQLLNCNFGSVDLCCVRCINCKLNKVYFYAADLAELKIEESQLVDVAFSGSEATDLIIQNSILRNIYFSDMRIFKPVIKNGISTIETIKIENYAHFLTEFVQNDSELLRSIMVFFTGITTLVYTFLKPELFSFFWQSKLENWIGIVN